MDNQIAAMLRPIKLLAMDVDGVLTDGTLGINDAGREQKQFHVSDGMGLTALCFAGVSVAWLSGRTSAAVTARASDLRIPYVIQGVKDKGLALSQLTLRLELPRTAVAFVGDDWNDMLAFEVAGVRIAVSNADDLVRAAADLVTKRTGGHGAVREVCDALLEAMGARRAILQQYLASLKETSTDGSTGQ